MFAVLHVLKNRIPSLIAGLAMLSAPMMVGSASAQVLPQQQGDATRVDLVAQARNLSMREVYARSLYSHIRANPVVFQNPNFYVNYLIYLMQQDPEFDCDNAFASEFERRDFFTEAFNLQAQLAEIINSVTITERFDVSYIVATGEYDFSTGQLPLESRQAVDLSQPLGGRIQARGGRYQSRQCANTILRGTNVDAEQFPWEFRLVNEDGENREPPFPFSQPLQLSVDDARQLFQRFGRQLYAIVSYQVSASNDGSRQIQVVATDGQLFGLSSDAVVRVNSFAHPTRSQASYLDVSNPLELQLDEFRTTMEMSFQQQGFRAVGSGTRLGNGTDFSAAVSMPVTGSGAVGNSGFIMRLSSPQLLSDAQRMSGLSDIPGAERYLTIYGSVDFEQITQFQAPVSGIVVVQQVNAQTGLLESSRNPVRFVGRFRAPDARNEETVAPQEPTSQLDELVIQPDVAADAPATSTQ